MGVKGVGGVVSAVWKTHGAARHACHEVNPNKAFADGAVKMRVAPRHPQSEISQMTPTTPTPQPTRQFSDWEGLLSVAVYGTLIRVYAGLGTESVMGPGKPSQRASRGRIRPTAQG